LCSRRNLPKIFRQRIYIKVGGNINTMNTTSISLLQTITSTDGTLTQQQRAILRDLIEGRTAPRLTNDGPMLLTQKQAARMLSISRVTLWRMTKAGYFLPVEILPGTSRYRYEEVEAVARLGKDARPIAA
jgi:predicted DNA-binding transcriptional regulator AlpA